jgi:alpha-tubulin suppressor-like RCC1 family protein
MHRVSRLFVALIVLALVTALAPTATVLAQSSAAAAPVTAPAPGLIRGWGDDSRGQIGIANTIACPNPTPATCPNPFPGLSSFGVVKVAAGDLHTVILRGDGMVWSVGDNTRAQLGQASTTPPSRPRRYG